MTTMSRLGSRIAVRVAGAGWILILLPTTALAEVMDKEPSLREIWSRSALSIVVAALLGRWKWWLPILIWPLSTLYAVGLLLELHDPYVGPAILHEAGWSYIVQGHVAAFACIAGPLATIAWSVLRYRNARPSSSSDSRTSSA
jgi:hypothetical protein